MYKCIKISLVLLFLYTHDLHAQLNLKIGYGFSYQNLEETNKIIQKYNEQNTWLTDKFKNIHYFQSLDVGLRYRWEFVGLELNWQKGFNRKKAKGFNPLTSANYTQTLSFTIDRYAVGYENYYRNFGIGASLDFNIYTIKAKINKEEKQKINSDQNFSSQFHISYTFANNSAIKFMIKPYVQISWSQIDLTSFAQKLNQESELSPLMENPMSYGLMLIFYQGN